jgi:DhnA family fructose-bisphosphate aldolase class Ia
MFRPNATNKNIQWEETTTTNIGLDYGLFNGRINGSLEFYLRKTEKLFNVIDNPAGGFSNKIIANVGTMENRGVEFNINADIIKQKLPENNGGYSALNMGGSSYGKLDKRMYTELSSDHPIDLCRYQVANCYMGRIGLINSGGASGENDMSEAVATAVINKRAGGMGLISGRKAFQKPMNEGIALLQGIQDVYLCKEITVA